MTDIFVSYAREDRDRVAPFVSLLESLGLSVWWDRNIKPGDSFEGDIDKAILEARCVLVVWSRHSIDSQWVRSEALEGMDRGILVPVLFDEVRVPVAFRRLQAAGFHGWPQTCDQAQYEDLVKSVKVTLNRDLGPASNPTKFLIRRHRSQILTSVAAGVIALGVAVYLVIFEFRPAEDPSGVAQEASVLAVLPFSPGSEEARYAADSLTHETSQALRSLPGLILLNPEKSKSFSADTPAAKLPFDYDYLLRGTVQSNGIGLTVNAVLESRAGGSDSLGNYQASGADLLAVQQALLSDLLQALGVDLSPIAVARLGSAVSSDPATYRRYLLARDKLRKGELDDLRSAVEYLVRVTGDDPQFAAGFAALCKAHLRLYRVEKDPDEFSRAEAACRKSLDIAPDALDLHLALGELYAAAGESEKSQTEYFMVVASESNLADAYGGLGALYSQDGRIAEAQAAFQRATALEPDYWKAHSAMGSFLLRQGMYYQAGESYKKVVQLAPNNALGYTNLGAAQFYLGDFEASFRSWQRASELNKDPGAHSNMGFSLYLLGRFEEAAAYVRKAIDANPNDYRLWGNLADNLRFLPGQEEEARDTYARSVELAEAVRAINPRDVYVISRLAVFYAALDKDELARSFIVSAQDMAQNDVYVIYDIAVALDILGEAELARQSLALAVENGYPVVLAEADPQFH